MIVVASVIRVRTVLRMRLLKILGLKPFARRQRFFAGLKSAAAGRSSSRAEAGGSHLAEKVKRAGETPALRNGSDATGMCEVSCAVALGLD